MNGFGFGFGKNMGGGLVPSIANGWFSGGVSLGNIDVALTEISGIATPTDPFNEGFIFAILDGANASYKSINIGNPAITATFNVTGVVVAGLDLESMSTLRKDGISYVYLGYTGDNANALATFKIVRGIEQFGSSGNMAGAEIVCEYPPANIPAHKDCEAMFADPDTGDIWLINKRVTPIPMYRLPWSGFYVGTQTLEFMGFMTNYAPLNTLTTVRSGNNGYVVDATINPFNSREIFVKSYSKVFRWYRAVGETIQQALQRPPDQDLSEMYVGGGLADPRGIHPNGEPQGEAICHAKNGLDLYTCSEFLASDGSTAARFPLFKYTRLAKQPTTLTLQQGLTGYAGCIDTFIDQAAPAVRQDAAVSIVADFDYSAYPTTSRVRQILMKFNLAGQIASNANVVGAHLDVYINTEGLGFQIHEILGQVWNEETTWNSVGGAIQTNNVAAGEDPFSIVYTPAGSGLDLYVGFIRMNIPPEVVMRAIAKNSFDILIQAPVEDATGDGVQIDSAESATQARKPKLVINYTT